MQLMELSKKINKLQGGEMKAVVYSGLNCVWCDRVFKALEATHIEVEKKMITDEGVKKEINEILGKKIKSVPQVTIDGKLLGGYTEVERFLRSLH